MAPGATHTANFYASGAVPNEANNTFARLIP